jgi:biotin carboxyl carrier protein
VVFGFKNLSHFSRAYKETFDRLQAGDTLIVIEAMKMQNSYKVATD